MEVRRVIDILCDYRGQDLLIEQIEIVPDMEIADLYAARVCGEEDYLVHAERGSVEPVAFGGDWPPHRPDGRPSLTEERPRWAAVPPVPVERLMARDVRFCRAEDTLEGAAQIMWERDCGSVPVCSEGAPELIGMITDRDVCMSAWFKARSLRAIQVLEAMSREVVSCGPRDSSQRVARLMREHRIRRVPVVDAEHRLLGIVSLADLAKAAQRREAVGLDEMTDTLAAIVAPYRGDARRVAPS